MIDGVPEVPAGTVDLERSLDEYGAFLAHQLGELAVLVGAVGETPSALSAASARLERMVLDLHDLRAPVGVTTWVDVGAEAAAVASQLDGPERRVTVDVRGSVPAVTADPVLARALLGHLMRPVVAASRSDVRFELRARPGGGARVTLELADDSGQAAARPAAFERPAGTGSLLGAGVSGPAARRIVAAHGGGLQFAPGDHGQVASFDLPAAEGA